jgi:anthranilate/para-aminobenzoate synthase component II
MKTALIVCTDNRETLSYQFIDTLEENQVAHRVIASDFQQIEKHVQSAIDVEHIVVFPCVIGLPDDQLKNLQDRINTLQKQHPQTGIHLANPLGSDPRLI